MGKLIIIDGNAILHRAFHAIPPLTTPKHEPINAVYGLVSMLLNIIQNLKPDSIVVAFDEKAPTFRQKELPTYQAQRPPMADDLSSQFQKARNFLSAAKIPVYSIAGYEADDVIGTIASEAIKSKRVKEYKSVSQTSTLTLSSSPALINEVIIVTGDRDQLQLVDDEKNIKLYMPIAGLINAKLYDEVATVERMGVPPSQIVDLKSLTGDPSDNYFGVVGIGPKTANSLLSK
jgi:DNA polymerase I